MRIFTLLVLTVFTTQLVTAQNKISGKVVDAMNRLPLPDATVTIINPVDSAAMGFAVADKTGLFEIKNLPKGNFVLGITFTGYAPYTKHLNITQPKFVMNLDTIFMQLDSSLMLNSVIVQAPPIQVKKDTIEFRAGSFKTKPNATVEDLLKKLPGVEVDKEGNVTAQGEEITKIYVDGKEFFLNDPKLATKNLSSDMIEAVQVFDDMSEQAKFTKIDDGSRKRTINLKLKKDKKKGIFGRSSASLGTSDRYEASGSFNTFNNRQQISVLGSANNINKLGFTSNDLEALRVEGVAAAAAMVLRQPMVTPNHGVQVSITVMNGEPGSISPEAILLPAPITATTAKATGKTFSGTTRWLTSTAHPIVIITTSITAWVSDWNIPSTV